MSGDLPPLLPPPFPRAVEVETEPGLGLLALKAENARLRRERNEARAALSGSDSVPPPTRRQKAVGVSLGLGKWAVLLALLPTVGAALTKIWPEYADVIAAIASVFAP